MNDKSGLYALAIVAVIALVVVYLSRKSEPVVTAQRLGNLFVKRNPDGTLESVQPVE